jgi:hypothetical protein
MLAATQVIHDTKQGLGNPASKTLTSSLEGDMTFVICSRDCLYLSLHMLYRQNIRRIDLSYRQHSHMALSEAIREPGASHHPEM